MEHPYGYIKEGKVYLKGFLNQEDRVIGEVKEDEASTIKYFEERFEMLLEKVNKLKQDIEENQNKGSFLMKLIHLRDSLYAYDALGDFVPVIEELNGIQSYLEEIIQQNRERNKTIKESLIMEALDLKDSDEWKEAGEAMKELKMRWIKTGPVDKELEEEMERTFNAILDYFFDRRKQFFDELAKQAEVNIKTYESLVMQAQQAFNMPDAKKAFEISKRIQKEWKEAGRVPAERRAPLWDEFSKLNNRIFSRYRRSLQTGPQLRPWEITKKMEEMLAEVKRIAKSPSTYEGTNTVKKIQGEWKKLPPRKPREAKLLMSSFQFFAEVAFEKAFLEKLAKGKYEDYREMTPEEQKKIKAGILKDLLQRDEKELETFKDNAENFRTDEGDAAMMIRRKLSTYKRKVDVKNYILKELSNI